LSKFATIPICDDEPVLRALARASLSEGRYGIVEPRDGNEALIAARHERPHVIVVDMMMPGRSGTEELLAV
jgi:CheY-like chemotaxis protein